MKKLSARILSLFCAFLFTLYGVSAGDAAALVNAADSTQKKSVRESGFVSLEDSSVGLNVKVVGKNGHNDIIIESETDENGNYPEPLDVLAFEVQNFVSGHVSPVRITITDSTGLSLYVCAEAKKTEYHYGIDEFGVVSTWEVYENYFRVGKETGKNICLIDYSLLRDEWGSGEKTQKRLKDIKTVRLGFSTNYNVGETIAINRIYTMSFGNYVLDKNTPALMNENGFAVNGLEVAEQAEKQTVYDFLALKSGTAYNEIPKVSYDPENCGNGLQISVKSTRKCVYLNNSMVNAAKLSLTAGGTITSSTPGDKNYSPDLFAYCDLWEAESSADYVDVHDGLALKVMNVFAGLAFRLVLIDEDGEIYYTGTSNLKSSKAYLPCITDDMVDIGCESYWSCLWPSRTAGTVYYPYSLLARSDLSNNNPDPPENTNGVLDKIVKVQLALDTATEYVMNASVAIGALADVDMQAERLYGVFDTAEYTAEEINTKYPMLSTAVKPAAPESDSFKNGNWRLGRVSESETVGRSKMDKAYQGDVKIIEDFSCPEYYSETLREQLAANIFYADGQKSYRTFTDNKNDAYGTSYKLTVGDYTTEYKNLGNDWCSVTVAGSGITLAEDWGKIGTAQGFSLYVENPQDFMVDFNFEFAQLQKDGSYERWGVNKAGGKVYAYNTDTGKELTLSATYSIYLPANFRGYLRIPFAVFNNPLWNYESDGIFDATCDLVGIFLSLEMQRNSGATLIFDDIGLYYKTFTVNSSFRKSATIKDCLNSVYFGG
ncbi:MAG: hypothetical protein ACI4SH_02510 [Candidatus Scatosoma sp.]